MTKFKLFIVAIAAVTSMSGCGSGSEPSPARETSGPANNPAATQENYPAPVVVPTEVYSYPEPVEQSAPSQESYPAP